MTYRDILQTDYFFEMYTQVEVLKRDFPVNHGFLHVWHVIKNAEQLAEMFNLTKKDKKLLLIAATLHDIGYTEGRENHDINGARLAREFLSNKLSADDINKICKAISNHGGDECECFQDKISLCLILADKFDFDHTRYRYDPTWASVGMYLSIKKVEFTKEINNDYTFIIYSDNLNLFKNYQEQHFFKKLNRVFSNFEKVTGNKLILKFANYNK